MTTRLNLQEATAQIYRRMGALEQAVQEASLEAGIEPALYDLIKIRASQINGCAFCLDMHSQDATAAGEDERRIHTLSAWRETTFFTDAERAALALTEQITRINEFGVSDEVWAQAERQFDKAQLAVLVWAIVAINAWNRMAISTGFPEPGSYHRKSVAAD